MRKLAFLLMLAGVGLAYLYPLYQEQSAGEVFAGKRIFDRSSGGWENGWQTAELDISETQSPVRIRLKGTISSGAYFQNNVLPLTLELDGPDGKVFETTLVINNRENNDASRGTEKAIFANTVEFGILASGKHVLTASTSLDRDISLLTMDAAFVANVNAIDNQYRDIGLGMFVGGMLLLIVTRKRRKNKPQPAKAKSQWGRRK
jgi:hypothetical protein